MLNDLGNAYVAAGDVNAIDTLREAVEVNRSSGGRGLGRVLNDLGNAYVAAGDGNAIDTLREAVKLQQEVPRACAERSGQCVCGSW